jgi:hypothetical protein
VRPSCVVVFAESDVRHLEISLWLGTMAGRERQIARATKTTTCPLLRAYRVLLQLARALHHPWPTSDEQGAKHRAACERVCSRSYM